MYQTQLVPTRFEWRYGGRQVHVCGSFTGWQEMVPMQAETAPSASGAVVHRVTINIPPGYHQYKFMVDNEWCHDESQPYMPSPLGPPNNWLHVNPPNEAQGAIGAPGVTPALCSSFSPRKKPRAAESLWNQDSESMRLARHPRSQNGVARQTPPSSDAASRGNTFSCFGSGHRMRAFRKPRTSSTDASFTYLTATGTFEIEPLYVLPLETNEERRKTTIAKTVCCQRRCLLYTSPSPRDRG